MVSKTLLFFALAANNAAGTAVSSHPVHLSTKRALDSGLANIHLSAAQAATIDVSFGSCSDNDNVHHHVKHGVDIDTEADSRLVWIIPEDAPSSGCLSAWDAATGELKGRSEELNLANAKNRKRDLESIKMTKEDFALDGPWFDGVLYLKERNVSSVDVKKAKAKKIGIIGGGMSGLMTSLLLESVGIHNWEIQESSHRVGGRIRTVYLEGEPDDYQYQEMGPMRFPYEATYGDSKTPLRIKDHQLVFDLVDELNRKNKKKNPELLLKFIDFININPNVPNYLSGIRNADGSIPTLGESTNDPRFTTQDSSEVLAIKEDIQSKFLGILNMTEFVNNMFETHKKFIDNGWDEWSEFSYMTQKLGASVQTANAASFVDAGQQSSFWSTLLESSYFTNTTMKTIDKGLEEIPKAFAPHIAGRINYNRSVTALSYNDSKVKVSWSPTNPTTPSTDPVPSTTATYDYAVIAVPFTQVRKWALPPSFPPTLRRAIKNYGYAATCKVALQFKKRFWEHKAKNPIKGGCAQTDLPGIGQFCYPSYKIGSKGPAVMLASYSFGDDGYRYLGLTDDQHARHTLDAMVEIHGDIAEEQYTGKFNRQCWLLDPHTSGAWAQPNIGQHMAYIPEFFKTVNGTVWVGEHTSYTHAWIASALESALRGTVQLLLELGLVDEAKQVVEAWLTRWVNL